MNALWFIRIAMLIMFVLPGLLSLWVGIAGSKWFFESHGTRFLRHKLGVNGARIIYVILGLLLLGCGIIFILDPLGVMSDTSVQ